MQREPHPATVSRIPRVSRRLLLAGSATAAASLALGAGIEHMAEQATQTRSGPDQEVIVKVASPMDWFAVTTVAALAHSAVKFRVEMLNGARLLTGYVLRSDGTNGLASEKGKIIALSAACTHKGCIVNWSDSDRKFHCPCHDGVFMEDGSVDAHTSSWLYIDSLPALEAREEDNGQISVRMPKS